MNDLHNDPRFQVLRAKAETHLYQHLPKKYAQLKKSGKLDSHLNSVAEQAWDQIKAARESGYSLDQAEEFAKDLLYPSNEEPQEEPDLMQEWADRKMARTVVPSNTKRQSQPPKR